MGDLIRFPFNEGNGAPAIVGRYFSETAYAEYLKAGPDPALSQEDHFLSWLWVEGFKVVPVTGDE